MRKSSRQQFGQSLSIAVVFICTVVLFLLVGVSVKLTLLFMSSSFDGTHQYILSLNSKSNPSELIVYSPQTKSASLVTIHGGNAQGIDVPVDASANVPYIHSIPKLTQNIFAASDKDNMTILDAIRLFLFVNSLNQDSFHYQEITLPLSAVDREKLFSNLFFDNGLYADNESVAVINATGESGIGSKVAHMLTTIGVNVISVTSSDPQATSILTSSHTQSYTAQRIAKLFRVHPQNTGSAGSLSDSTLTIGKDSLERLQ